jgi:hypothetical protein
VQADVGGSLQGQMQQGPLLGGPGLTPCGCIMTYPDVHQQIVRGDVQVSERERKVELEEMFRDVASVILEKCVNPETNRPYTLGLIQRGLKEIHFAADPKRGVKQQVCHGAFQVQCSCTTYVGVTPQTLHSVSF